jgi:rifampicin phosphotransferase
VLGMLALLVNSPVVEESAKINQVGIIDQLTWPMRLTISMVHYFTRKYLDLREELRFLLDEILFAIRSSLLQLGKSAALGEDAMFLTEAELSALIQGSMAPESAKRLVRERLAEYRQEQEPDTYLVDGCPYHHFGTGEGVFRGIGTSPGKATGYARIVEDPSAANLQKGDILVAKHTDPGWTPVLSIVGGVVTEEGGLLNHCSIVARELGIPAVVGVRQATRRIPEGTTVKVDGNLGIVQIEDPS